MSSGIIIPGKENEENEKQDEDDREMVRYESCGFYIETKETYEEALGRALVGATLRRRAQAQQQAMQQHGIDATTARLAAESVEVKDPFAMEPAALGVFMLMVKELQKLREEIKDLKESAQK